MDGIGIMKTFNNHLDTISGAAKDVNSAVPIIKLYGKWTATLQFIIMVFIIAIFISILVYGQRLIKKQQA